MVKRITKKQRGKQTRVIKKMIVAGLEGNNVTEKQYLNHFNSISKNYRIIFSRGNSTDPVGIVEDTIRSLRKFDFDFELGDKAYCLIDTDYGKERELMLSEAIELAKKSQIDVLLSNPTFEVWFLLHFRYSTRQYSNNNDVIIELRKYIEDYEKNMDVFTRLECFLDTALKNSNKLEQFHDKNKSLKIMERCPSSQVFKLVDLLHHKD